MGAATQIQLFKIFPAVRAAENTIDISELDDLIETLVCRKQ